MGIRSRIRRGGYDVCVEEQERDWTVSLSSPDGVGRESVKGC